MPNLPDGAVTLLFTDIEGYLTASARTAAGPIESGRSALPAGRRPAVASGPARSSCSGGSGGCASGWGMMLQLDDRSSHPARWPLCSD
jgi:hypothetical protein